MKKEAEEYQSLYEFRGHAAGKLGDGKQVYKEAVRRGIEVKSQEVNISNYKGSVMIYPTSFLNKYFDIDPVAPTNILEKVADVKVGKQPAVHEVLQTMWWAKINRLMPMDIVLNVLTKLDLRTDAWSITEQGYTFYSKDGKTTYKYGK
jgi:hypothetical protein|tara:strand:- start:285 stop:728 length:444 start_codon:yes stop_codon:yes gene_type:complete